jgi:hypothetical protein
MNAAAIRAPKITKTIVQQTIQQRWPPVQREQNGLALGFSIRADQREQLLVELNALNNEQQKIIVYVNSLFKFSCIEKNYFGSNML